MYVERKGDFRMRGYEVERKDVLKIAICNCCGKELKLEKGYLKEACITADITFGYFSHRDGVHHRFDLCEGCYDKIIANFVIPVDENLEAEFL